MRRFTTILFIFLSLAVATSEIPELCNLVDDPSNNAEPSALEYHAALTQEQTALESAEPSRVAVRHFSATSSFSQRESSTRGLLLSAWTGRDVLLFISSLRT